MGVLQLLLGDDFVQGLVGLGMAQTLFGLLDVPHEFDLIDCGSLLVSFVILDELMQTPCLLLQDFRIWLYG